MRCIFCEKNPSVKKSHIIPEFLYKDTYNPSPKQAWMIDKDLKKIGVRQKGLYEPLLCTECEGYFSKHFEHPSKPFFDGIPYEKESGKVWIGEACPQLYFLALAILWRGSHSSSGYFNCNLGYHQKRICRILKDYDPDQQFFPEYPMLFLIPYFDNGKTTRGIVSPIINSRVGGYAHHYYQFLAGGVNFRIKVSSHDDKITPPVNFFKPVQMHYISVSDCPATLPQIKTK